MLVVLSDDRPPRLGPLLEIAQLHAQDRALKPFHPIVVSAQHVMILAVLSPIAQHADGACMLGVVGGHGATLAVGSQILTGIKAEACHIADASDWTSFIFSSVRLRGVFNNYQ